MTLWLYWLTLAVATLIVLALAGFLIAIAWTLAVARRDVARLADGLEAVAEHTAGLDERLGTIDGVLARAADDFVAVDGNLAGVARIFGR